MGSRTPIPFWRSRLLYESPARRLSPVLSQDDLVELTLYIRKDE